MSAFGEHHQKFLTFSYPTYSTYTLVYLKYDEYNLFNKPNKALRYICYTTYTEATRMKEHIGLTIDCELLKEIEKLRGREKRSTFIEHLLKLGLKVYLEGKNEQKKV